MTEENKNIPGYTGASLDKEPEKPAENIPAEINPPEDIAIPGTGEQPLNSSTEASAKVDIKPLNDSNDIMEVHHHTHPSHGKKNWKSFFWEFLMLFLAVFCGFLAEYQLEHVIENQREKKFIRSFIEDLKSDTVLITQYVNSKIEKRKVHDSLIWYLNSPDPNQYGQRIYLFARQLIRGMNFIPADGTIKQLKNSGGLRLIKNQQVSDSIMAYNQAIDRILITQSRQENEINELRPMMGKLMDANVLETMVYGDVVNPPLGNPPLRTVDKEFILDFIYAVHQLKGSDAINAVRLQRIKERAIGIILFMQKEYHLE